MEILITEFPTQSAWIVPLLPLLASASIGSAPFPFPTSARSLRRLSLFASISLLSTAMVISSVIFCQQVTGGEIHRSSWSWIVYGNITLEMGYLIDPLTSVMLVLVTTAGTTVMIYSDGYMSHDQGYVRFFAYLSLFIASMLALVPSPNLIQIYIFRELVGVCSYLLIGFWYTRPSAASACQKAFVINRVGDFGLLLGILGLYWITGSFEFQELSRRFLELLEADGTIPFFATLCAFSLFLGPMAKSAQLPLHTWLPDAMEGPTPISALIHAATMVAAGIFLVARMLPVFQILPPVMNIISWVGALTALLGAGIATIQKDLKKGLAHSTISQLGYMMLALGIGSYKAGLFHLITHAYSKALSFPGPGSVIHAMEPIAGYRPERSQNMGSMGGLRRYMPITAITFLAGTLSLCGIPPFACFWSKDEIIADSWLSLPILGFIASFTAGLTSFYMFRIYLLTLEGDLPPPKSSSSSSTPSISIWGESNPDEFFRVGESPEVGGGREILSPDRNNASGIGELHPKESDNLMLFPLLLLAVPTSFAGCVGFYSPREPHTNLLSAWLNLSINPSNREAPSEDILSFLSDATASIGIAFAGIVIALYPYVSEAYSRGINSFGGRGENITNNKDSGTRSIYHIFPEEIINWYHNYGYTNSNSDAFFTKCLRISINISSLFDQWVIDGVVNGFGVLSFFGGECFRYVEGGRISYYLYYLTFGMVSPLFLARGYMY
uniref:NAD(P)H-quinone oxidoreductase subunit 5, chloroplastic n=1 Tax=Haplomitrium blumei TaxID=258993 RepID=A0A4Y5P7T0_9MARC|nr:NADH-plastoquinone oxidoreductase subunit 5 [Haplomitrium blumei]YP_009668615.1 NADH-plastoquinone oxidoreductase subunit 5 [Haplomitrium blumei]QCW59390.1 NADH-plastoquinone oxidoreductase subunit 5 [Haplomitrium blumei]QCW59391.1 NADH-plastoquinone oxidoreductase subunit 5 [Haplomitrium blumei]